MVRQRVWTMWQMWRARVVIAAALTVLVALASSGYLVATHRATSLQIIAWRHVDQISESQPGIVPTFPPDVKVFDKTITDQKLVHNAQEALNGLERGAWGGCIVASTTYKYEFRFATLGVTTQVYTGQTDCGTWDVTALGVVPGVIKIFVPLDFDTVAVAGATLDGVEILEALHQRVGMPLPSRYLGN